MRFALSFSQTDQKLAVNFKDTDNSLGVGFKNFQTVTLKPDVEYYEGPYEATPTVETQSVPTAHKYLTSDFEVKAIPYAEATNSANGKTVTIGG